MTNKPIESFYAGNIEVAIWENQGEGARTFHTVTAKRSYMDGNGEWKDAGTVHLLAQQIPDMILALQKSHEHLRMGMRQQRRQQTRSNDGSGQSGSAPAEPPAAQTQSELIPEGEAEAQKGFVGRVGQSRGGRRSR